MSEAAVETTEETAENPVEKINEYKKLDPMTHEEFQQIEREIQTGVRDTLPDGRSIADVQKSLEETQLAQEKERREKYLPEDEKTATDKKVEILVAENGAMSARPLQPESGEKTDDTGETESDLPADLFARDKLIAGGVTTLEMLGKLGHDELILIPGIKDATAEKILSYGKSA